MTQDPVLTRTEGAVGVITFNRPEVLNAFNSALIDQTGAALAAFAGDEAVSAVVIHGAGRSFSAGFDLKESAARATTGASFSPKGSPTTPSTSPRLTRWPSATAGRNMPLAGARSQALERATRGSGRSRRRFNGGSMPSARITRTTPMTPARIQDSSKRSASPAS